MSAQEEKVIEVKGLVASSHFGETQQGEASKLNITEIQKNFADYLSDPRTIERLQAMGEEQQKLHIINLIATATEVQLNELTKANVQFLGGKVAPALQQLFTNGITARRDFFLMTNRELCTNIAAYLTGGAKILDAEFNAEVHHQFNELAAFMPKAERRQWLYQVITMAETAAVGNLSRLFTSEVAFGEAVANEFNDMMAMLKTQDFVSAENPAQILADPDFNSGIYNAFPTIFAQHIAAKSGAIEEKFDVSKMDDTAKTRVCRHLEQMNNEFSRTLMELFQRQAVQAQQDEAVAATSSQTAASSSQSARVSEVGIFGQQELRRRNVGKKAELPSAELVVVDGDHPRVNPDEVGCFANLCNIL